MIFALVSVLWLLGTLDRLAIWSNHGYGFGGNFGAVLFGADFSIVFGVVALRGKPLGR